MTKSTHHSYQIGLMFTLGHSYGRSKLSLFELKHKWTVPKLNNVHTINLICPFGNRYHKYARVGTYHIQTP